MYAAPLAVRPPAGGQLALRRLPWALLAALAITLLAGVLRLSSLDHTASNPFYDAAVRSMGLSWHNFFYAAFDPGARMAIDKPPVDLWLQVLSVKLLGQTSQALILPQALAATAAVPLLFDTVRRVAGSGAGLVAALALAVMPVSVETARSDTMDSVMAALCVLAAWMVVRAVQTGRARWLYAAAVVIGTSFEVKLLEGLLALPALAVLYAVAAPHPWRRRLAHGLAAGGAFLAAALWWPVAVSLAAPSQRPFAIGSTDGSVWSAIFYYNGLERLSPAGMHGAIVSGPGRPGVLRLFGMQGGRFGQNLGVELLAALAFGLAALLLELWARHSLRPRPRANRIAIGAGAALALWVATGFAIFSSMQTAVHLRYLEAMAPPIAALLGVGVAGCARACGRRGGVIAPLLTAAALAATAAYVIAADQSLRPVVRGAAALACVVAVAWTLLRTRAAARPGAAVAVAVLIGVCCTTAALVVPAQRGQRLVDIRASDSGSPGSHRTARAARVQGYLATHARAYRYDVVVDSYIAAAPLIVNHGRPLVLESVNRRQVVGRAELARIVVLRQVRYALIGGRCGSAAISHMAGCPRLDKWIRLHSVDVSRRAGFHRRGELFRFTV